MQTESFTIHGIPALLWGPPSGRVIVAVHGSGSHKADAPFEILARCALPKGWQVMSFDLPGHGSRREGPPCQAQVCVPELQAVMHYALAHWEQAALFANSLGVYFSLLALRDAPVCHAWFLSPLVDMQRMIRDMMTWFRVSEARLQAEGTVPTPMGQSLSWNDFLYVKAHPVDAWPVPTHILYGERDDTCPRETVEAFARRFGCTMQVVPGAEHWFHTPGQLQALGQWLEATL